MIIKIAALVKLLATVTAISASSSTDNIDVIKCGTYLSPHEIAEREAYFTANADVRHTLTENVAAAATANAYWHVISTDGTAAGGNVSDAQIHLWMAALNSGFASTGLLFNLVNISRTVNPTWFNIPDYVGTVQTQMKQALHIGSTADLNLYTVGSIKATDGQALLGYAHYPSSIPIVGLIEDGVVAVLPSLPIGEVTTLIHETGHWVGLYHTFEGDRCGGPGDYVADTPDEQSAAFGCPIGRDTCPQPSRLSTCLEWAIAGRDD